MPLYTDDYMLATDPTFLQRVSDIWNAYAGVV
jgi:hypothetical protein